VGVARRQDLTGSSPALAPGLRAGNRGPRTIPQTEKETAMIPFRSLVKVVVVAGLVAVLWCGPGAGTAAAQSVKGNGIVKQSNGAEDGANFYNKVTVNAWVDADGFAQGKIVWQGDINQTLPQGNTGTPGGPAEPFIIQVTDIFVVGNTAYVAGIVVSSPKGIGNGSFASFFFTDNSATDEPDELNFVPLTAGDGYTVED
jgi:hypothetical protein